MVTQLFGAELVGSVATEGAKAGLFAPLQPALELLEQTVNKAAPVRIPAESVLTELFLTGRLRGADYTEYMSKLGYPAASIELFLAAARRILPESLVMDSMHRGIVTEPVAERMLREKGWDDEQIGIIKAQALFYPGAVDVINWIAKDVYRPDTIKKYDLTSEFDLIDKTPLAKAGISEEQAKNYWIAHWNRPSFGDVQRMLYYGQLTLDDVRAFFGLLEIPEYWRDKYMATVYEPYTRVDIRRMWNLGVLSDEEVIIAYMHIGYDRESSINLLKFTKLEELLPQLKAAYRNNQLSTSELRIALQDIGLGAVVLERIMRTVIKIEKPTRAQEGKKLSEGRIRKALQAGLITRTIGKQLLSRLHYDEDEVELLLQLDMAGFTLGPDDRYRRSH